MIEIGLKHTSELTVTEDVIAITVGSGDLPVLATPMMMALMENAAMLAVVDELPEGCTTVGGHIESSTIFNRLVPENRPEYEHTLEGADDMPAHAKSTLSGVSITIPITDGRLNLGTWQGIYFCEYRNFGGSRELVVTIIGE